MLNIYLTIKQEFRNLGYLSGTSGKSKVKINMNHENYLLANTYIFKLSLDFCNM